jgi:transposase InsO family protein
MVPHLAAGKRPDLIGRDFQPDPAGIDTRWCGDITYIPTDEGWLYPATVIDVASRRVIGWATAGHLRTARAAASRGHRDRCSAQQLACSQAARRPTAHHASTRCCSTRRSGVAAGEWPG